jgi:hypothetical protein
MLPLAVPEVARDVRGWNVLDGTKHRPPIGCADDGSVNFSLHLVTLSRDAVRNSLIKGEVPGPGAGNEEA